MAIRARSSSPRKIGWSLLLLLIVIGARYYRDHSQEPARPTTRTAREEIESSTTKQAGWTIHRACTLVPHALNDGDSFRAKLPDGSEREFRLNFVDTPESQFKRYRDGNTNAKRIAEQARYFDNISSDQAVAIGSQAKQFTLSLLRDTPFDIITRQEAVFDSERHYAHIEIHYQAQRQRLDEMLVQRGLARIYTQGADLADGTPMEKHKQRLRALETKAKKQKVGAWK